MKWFILLQGLHVLFGVLWFGSALFHNLIVMPAIGRMDSKHQSSINKALSTSVVKFMVTVATLTIVFGVLLGFSGHIWSQLGSRYGLTFLGALIAATVTYFWGMLLIAPNTKKLDTSLPNSPEYFAALRRVKLFSASELGLFGIVFVIMIMLRFGY